MDLVARNMRTMPHKCWYLISISGVDKEGLIQSYLNDSYYGKYIKNTLREQGCKDFLALQFDDCLIEGYMLDGTMAVLFSKKQANDVIDFIEKINKDTNDFDLVIHCHAGISRSGAIAEFTSKYLNIPFEDPYIRPNTHVLKTLWETIDERNKKIGIII